MNMVTPAKFAMKNKSWMFLSALQEASILHQQHNYPIVSKDCLVLWISMYKLFISVWQWMHSENIGDILIYSKIEENHNNGLLEPEDFQDLQLYA